MMTGNAFFEIAQILGLAALLGAFGQKLRQPLIIMFLATGIPAGPSCLGIIESYEEIDLGARLDWASVGLHLYASMVFSVFVLIGNPIIVLIIMGLMGYRCRTGFMAVLTVAQISEFSLIVAALGMGLGHISKETMGLITLVGVVTIFFSTYMILYSHTLYRLLAKPLKIFERKKTYVVFLPF